MQNTFTLRRIIVAFFRFALLNLSVSTNLDAQVLPCYDAGVAVSGLGFGWVPVCGCDGISYVSDSAAIAAGNTLIMNNNCGVFTACPLDFYYEFNGLNYHFIDSSTSSGNSTYAWDFGDGTGSNNTDPFHSYLFPGYYQVNVTTTDSIISCYNYTTRIIHADISGSNSNYFYTYFTVSNPNCTNNGILTANIYGGNPPYSFLWNNGSTNQSISGLGNGNYSVSITDDSGLVATGIHNLIANCNNIIKGKIFYDINGNCLLDGGENSVQNVYVTANNGSNNYLGYADLNGNYSINIPTAGTYTLNAYSWSYGYGVCGTFTACSGNTVTFPSVGDTSTGNNLGFAVSTAHDLGIFATWSGANPGFQMHYNLWPYDFSVPSFTGLETVTFQYDPQLVYDSSNNAQVAHNITNHTLTHVGINAPNYYFGAPPIICYFTVPVSTPTNYMVQSDFYINPTTNDCDTSNNHLHISAAVTSSYDPNEKTVSPSGNILNTDSVLTYTIHFQNTGNDTTHFVIVTDTLPSSLEPTTVVNLASSAPFSEFTISGTGILKWVFNPLFLPDSTTNEPASKGFVMFKIKVKPNLPFGTVIENKASIFFDYNPAVITNYATNSIINGVEQLTVNSEQLTVYPNPANEQLTISSNKQIMNTIVITDVLGREIYSQPSNLKSEIINLKSFSSGIYLVKVQLANGNVEVRRFEKE